MELKDLSQAEKKKARAAARKFIEAQIVLDEAKEYYKERDEALLTLVELGLDNVTVRRREDERKYTIAIKDNFAETNVVYRAAGVSRFEGKMEVQEDEEQ